MKKVISAIKSFFTNLFKSNKSTEKRYEKVTRFEVVDHTHKRRGRIIVEYKINVDMSLQDDGKTMKIFLTDRK